MITVIPCQWLPFYNENKEVVTNQIKNENLLKLNN
jgi:hypothetical protein